jgi:Fur family ferric uptake transcriptional regulator
MLILHTLRAYPVHPTAVELYTRAREIMPSLSLGTVYRNLEMLTRSGEVVCLERAGTSRRFDGKTAAHGHVRCTVCGRVGDIDGALPAAVLENIRSPGFTILGMDVEFTGLCSKCRAEAERVRDASAPETALTGTHVDRAEAERVRDASAPETALTGAHVDRAEAERVRDASTPPRRRMRISGC